MQGRQRDRETGRRRDRGEDYDDDGALLQRPARARDRETERQRHRETERQRNSETAAIGPRRLARPFKTSGSGASEKRVVGALDE